MGGTSSKTPLERRNTVLRRSQRKHIAKFKLRNEELHKMIRRFPGVQEDDDYNAIKVDIDRLNRDLDRVGQNLQPQVVYPYKIQKEKALEAYALLRNKLTENRRKLEEDKTKKSKSKESKVKEEETEIVGLELEEDDEEEAKQEEEKLENTKEKRRTVELKFVKISADEPKTITEAEVHSESRLQSPEEKRKSILKQGGIAVMPDALMNEFTSHSRRISKHYDQHSHRNTTENALKRINDIIDCLQVIESDINEFVGKMNDYRYNRIRESLNNYLVELNQLNVNDDYAAEQLKVSKNYVSSCFSFLEERAVKDTAESVTSDDEVFLNNNSMQKPVVDDKLYRMMRNTAV